MSGAFLEMFESLERCSQAVLRIMIVNYSLDLAHAYLLKKATKNELVDSH